MRNLKKGSMVRYTGKTTGFFTYNKIYKVVEEAYEQYFSKTYGIIYLKVVIIWILNNGIMIEI